MSLMTARAACVAVGSAVLVACAWSGCGGTAVIDGAPGAGGSTTTTTTSSTTTSGSSGQGGQGGCSGTPVCPDDPPVHSGECVCSAGLQCEYDFCSTGGDEVIAECGGTVWVVDATLCEQIYCPNNILCDEDEVCLINNSGFTVAFSCESNPCSNEPLSCECGEKLCDTDYVCTEATAGQVTCECTTC